MTAAIATRVRFQPFGAGREAFSRHDPELVLSGPAGTGKTRSLLEKVHLCASKYPRMRGVLLRKTHSDLVGSALVTYQRKVLHALDGVSYFGGSAREAPAFRYPNGSEILVGGLDRASKVMSKEFDLAYVNEATELVEDDWESITTRLRNGVMPYQQLLADCNPDAPTHWLKQRADSGGTVMLESRLEDNPTLWDRLHKAWTEFGAAYIAKLDALTGVRKLRLRLGIWAAAEGMVYDGWDRKLHLVDRFEIPPDWPRYWSVDFGYTNPFVWQAWAEDPDGRLHRYREIYMTHRLVEDHARDILRAVGALDQSDDTTWRPDWGRDQAEPPPRALICDHDAEDRATLERKLGLSTIGATKAVSAGIQAVAERLRVAGDGKPRLQLLRDSLVERDGELVDARKPTCTEEEVESYVWDTSVKKDTAAARKRGEEPLKKDDHGCLVAGTLVETTSGAVPIERVTAGMWVQTRSGPRRVIAAGLSARSARVSTVCFSDGRSLTGTANHPVWVDRCGWTAVDALRYKDVICESSTATAEPSRHRPTTVGAPCASAARTPTASPTASTADAASLSASPGGPASSRFWSTWASGRLARRWTALTAPSRTSQAIAAGRQHVSSSPTGLASMCLLTSRRFASARLTGTPARQDAPGMLGMPKRWASASIPNTPRPASSAGRASQHGTWRISASAQTRARPAGATRAEPTTSSASAPHVAAPSPPIAIRKRAAARVRVLSVSDAGWADVFNLTVEGAPEYFANGVLVHNCDASRYLVAHFDLVGHVSYGPDLWQ